MSRTTRKRREGSSFLSSTNKNGVFHRGEERKKILVTRESHRRGRETAQGLEADKKSRKGPATGGHVRRGTTLEHNN